MNYRIPTDTIPSLPKRMKIVHGVFNYKPVRMCWP